MASICASVKSVRVEDDTGGISGEPVHREGIHLMHLDFVSHRSSSTAAGGRRRRPRVGHSSP